MSLFTDTETYAYHIYSPVMGDSYNSTVKYGVRKEKVPLDVVTTREMLALHGQGLNNSSNMKAQLKHLREIHNLPMLKKPYEFLSQNINSKVIDFSKLETMYGSTIQDISTNMYSALACEYIYKITNGKYSSIYDIEDVIIDDILSEINEEPGIFTTKITVVELKNIFITYIGSNTFNVITQVEIEITSSKPDSTPNVETVWRNFNVNLPDEFTYLWFIANDPNMYVIKFANGNMTHLDSNSLPNFQKQGDSKVEFSIPIILKQKYMSYPYNAAKRVEIARNKLGYQEYKNKKRNRQELLYESVQKNQDIEEDCSVNMYLDLFPFKDPKYRADRNWRLFLKGVMRYFARITGIGEIDVGHGLISVLVPPAMTIYSIIDNKTFQYMNVEIIKEKVSGPDLTKSTPYCFFEIDKPLNEDSGNKTYNYIKDKNKYVLENLNTVWLCLIVDMGNNKFIKYKLNYSRFYDGLQGFNSSEKILRTAEIISNVNKRLPERTETKAETEEEKNSRFDHIIEKMMSKKVGFWHDDRDINLTIWDEESFTLKDKIPTGVPNEDLNAFDVPRLPMPKLMWNMIPYSGKKVAYTSTLLINFRLEIEVKEDTGFASFLTFAIAIVITVVTLGTGAGAASSLMGIANSAVSKAIIIAGTWASAIGSVSGNKYLSYIGTAIGLWAGITGIVNSLSSGLSSLSGWDALTLGSKGVNFVVDIASKVRSLDMEKELQSMADELKNGQKQFEYEKDNRRDMWGGVARTNAAADEEIDQMLELVLQEGLFEVLTSYIDTEKNSTVFNDRKYDNTR